MTVLVPAGAASDGLRQLAFENQHNLSVEGRTREGGFTRDRGRREEAAGCGLRPRLRVAPLLAREDGGGADEDGAAVPSTIIASTV